MTPYRVVIIPRGNDEPPRLICYRQYSGTPAVVLNLDADRALDLARQLLDVVASEGKR